VRKSIYILVILFATLTTTFFDCGTPSAPPPTAGGGFNVQFFYNPPGTASVLDDSYVQGIAAWQRDATGAEGSVFNSPYSADAVGQVYVPGGRAPAYWIFGNSTGQCAGVTSPQIFVQLQGYGVAQLICLVTGLGVEEAAVGSYTASPGTIYTSSLPPSIEVSGGGFSSSYGMPRALYFNSQGTLEGEETATSIASNGAWISGPTPSGLSTLQTGIYIGLVQNATAGGGWEALGAAEIYLVTPVPYGGGGTSPPCRPCPSDPTGP
jgi:hypothetical protein